MSKKRLFTGLQPSGQLHIGNYFGALKPLAGLAGTEHYESVMLMVADYHALTTLKNPKELRENIISIVKDYLAVLGENTKNVTIFKQSDVPQHTELSWIFNCLVTQSFLELGHAFKDKQAKGLESNFGLLDYPVLMAADILLYSDIDATTWVPVGIDQEQHLEYTREIAAKFNTAFPGEQLFSYQISASRFGEVGKIPGTDGQKMSKSYKNIIPLFASEDQIRSSVMSIKTASVEPGEKLGSENDIIPTLYKQFDLLNFDQFKKDYKSGALGGYKQAKDKLLEVILKDTKEIRRRRNEITDDEVIETLKNGGEVARARAEEKMKLVRERIGVTL
ncbi:MAG TPA: tryptophan--tRNA ligase [Candidatus Paceibacterota bacterium]|nr:tryptophan--tRNA ligase [Candidatus Paceibacterota bacterium]